MQLREWQQRFQDAVLGETTTDDLPLQSRGLSPALSIGIYANAYRERLHEALHSNYPALHCLLGDDDFAAMAYGFIDKHPSQAASIRWFGADLSGYLQSVAPYDACPAIGELAQFEWALRHSVDAADAARVDAHYLQSLDPAQWTTLCFDVHPSLNLLHFDWNVPQVWRALDADQEPPPPTPLDSHWLVYRSAALTTEWRSAEALEVTAIQQWTRGKHFGAICEVLEAHLGDANDAAMTAASLMRGWIEQGLLVHTSSAPKTGE